MEEEIVHQIEGLRCAKVRELRERYREIFGEDTRSNHKEFLFRRIAWRLQALAEGELSERARERALAIAKDVDLRICGPRLKGGVQPTVPNGLSRNPRLPAPGTILVREFKTRKISVEVLEQGFQYEDRFYKSLSAIAREVTGTQWNGYAFFRLDAGGQG